VLHKKMKIIAEGRESLLLVAAFPESLGRHAEKNSEHHSKHACGPGWEKKGENARYGWLGKT